MKTLKLLCLLFVLVCFASCSSISVVSDYDRSIDFGQFKTYQIAKPNPEDMAAAKKEYPAIINPINQGRLESAITDEMEVRQYTESDNPDLIIYYYVKVATKTGYQATTTGWGGGPWMGPGYYGYYGGYGGLATTSITSYDYDVGTLIIDLVDVSDKKLAWYASASSVLSGNPDKVAEKIQEAVIKMFNNYKYIAGESEQVQTRDK